MLQQTQVIKVIDYFNAFIQKFPSLTSLADANLDSVLTLWSGLGYYNRAKNIHKTSRICQSDFNCQLPTDIDDLMKLPGIGRTTAGALLSLAHNRPYPILDGNVKRTFARHFMVQGKKPSETTKKLWQLVGDLIPHSQPRKYNQALMDIGSKICTPKKPNCKICPINGSCLALSKNKIDQFPAAKIKTKQIKQTHYLILLYCKNSLYLQQRKSLGIWPQLWFLPMYTTLKQRQNSVFMQTTTQIPTQTFSLQHILSHRILTLDVAIVKLNQHPTFKEEGQWIKLKSIQGKPHPTALVKIIKQLQIT